MLAANLKVRAKGSASAVGFAGATLQAVAGCAVEHFRTPDEPGMEFCGAYWDVHAWSATLHSTANMDPYLLCHPEVWVLAFAYQVSVQIPKNMPSSVWSALIPTIFSGGPSGASTLAGPFSETITFLLYELPGR